MERSSVISGTGAWRNPLTNRNNDFVLYNIFLAHTLGHSYPRSESDSLTAAATSPGVEDLGRLAAIPF